MIDDNLFDDIDSYLKNPSKEEPELDSLLNKFECLTLIMSLAIHRGDKGFSEEEVLRVQRWAEYIRIGAGMLQLVLSGEAIVNWDEEQNDCTIRLSKPEEAAQLRYYQERFDEIDD